MSRQLEALHVVAGTIAEIRDRLREEAGTGTISTLEDAITYLDGWVAASKAAAASAQAAYDRQHPRASS